MKKRVTIAAALAVALALTVSACSNAAVSGGSADKGASSEGITGKKILISQSSPESGPGASAAAYTAGLKASLEYANKNDKKALGGYQFDVATVDNQGNAAGGASAIRQILQTKPFAVVIDGSASFQASVDIIKAQDPALPTIGLGNAQIIHDAQLQNAFGLFSNYTRECYMQVDYAVKNLGLTNLALVYEDSPTGQGPAASCPAYAAKEGVKTFKSYAVPPPAVSTNYDAIAAQIQQQQPQLALFFGSNGEMVGLQKASYNLGSQAKWIGFAPSYDITYLQLAGPAAIGTYFDVFQQPVNSDTPEAKLFNKVMATAAPNAANAAGGYGWSYGFIITKAVQDAIKANKGVLTQAGFAKAMKAMKTGPIGLLYSTDFTIDPSTSISELNIYQVTGSGLNLVGKNLPIPAAQ